MTAVTWALQADMDFSGSWETDLTGYVERPGNGISFSRGMDFDGAYRVSTLTADLSNRSGAFTPQNSSGAFYGQLRPHVPVRIVATHAGVSYTLWTGYVQAWTPRWDAAGVSVCTLQAADLGKYLVEGEPVNLSADTGRDTDGFIEEALTAIGLTSSYWDLDDGLTALPYSYAVGQRPMEVVMAAVRSEMGGLAWVTAEGRLRFENRARRLGISRISQEVMLRTPAGYWRFGELSGASTALDSSGNGRNGTYSNDADPGATGGATGDHDGAAIFDGNNDYVSVADAAVFDATDFSVFGLVKRADGLKAGLVSKFTFSPSNQGYNVWIEGTDSGTPGRLAFEVAVGGTTQQIYGATAGDDIPDDGEWHSFAVTRSGDTLSIYADGALVRSSGGFVTGALSNSTALEFGRLYNGNNNPLNGWLDEFAFFGSVLTAEDVYALHLAATGAWVWGDDGTFYPRAFQYQLDDRELVSQVTVRGTRYVSGQDGEEVFRWSLGADSPNNDALLIPTGTVYTRSFKLQQAILTLYSATARQDYTANTNAGGDGTDKTGDITVTYTLNGSGEVRVDIANASGGDVYITMLRARGQTVSFYQDRPEAIQTKAIPNQLAGSGVAIDIPFADGDSTKLRDYAVQLLRTYRYEYPRLVLTFDAADDARKIALLSAELGDLVRYADAGLATGAYIDEWWRIEGIGYEIPPDLAGQSFPVAVSLVPSYLYRNLDAIAHDSFDRYTASGLGTSISGHTWTNGSAFDVTSNVAKPHTTSASLSYVDIGEADMVVEVSLAGLGGDTDEIAGVALRVSDASNYLRAVVSDDTNALNLQKVVAGTPTTIGTYAWTPAATAELRVMAQGNRLRVWLDRVLRIDTVDGSFNTATNAGLYALNTTVAEFNDFYAQGLS